MDRKQPLQRVLVLDASGHIGGPCAAHVQRELPGAQLQLAAFNGVDGAFVVTPGTDTGECAEAILGSSDAHHIGQIYHLDNGHDVMRLRQAAELASRALGEQITYDGSDEAFEQYCGEALRGYFGTPDAVDYYLHYFQFEQDNETVWRKSDIVEFLTGRPAKRLEDWLVEHRDAVLGRTPVAAT